MGDKWEEEGRHEEKVGWWVGEWKEGKKRDKAVEIHGHGFHSMVQITRKWKFSFIYIQVHRHLYMFSNKES